MSAKAWKEYVDQQLEIDEGSFLKSMCDWTQRAVKMIEAPQVNDQCKRFLQQSVTTFIDNVSKEQGWDTQPLKRFKVLTNLALTRLVKYVGVLRHKPNSQEQRAALDKQRAFWSRQKLTEECAVTMKYVVTKLTEMEVSTQEKYTKASLHLFLFKHLMWFHLVAEEIVRRILSFVLKDYSADEKKDEETKKAFELVLVNMQQRFALAQHSEKRVVKEAIKIEELN